MLCTNSGGRYHDVSDMFVFKVTRQICVQEWKMNAKL